MSTLARRAQRSTNTWPGFVDALATLLMVIIFLLMIFVLAQFFLGEALSGRDAALKKLQNDIADMSDLLSLERKANDKMRLDVAQLTAELQASVISRDDLKSSLSAMTDKAEAAEKQAATLTARLDDAMAVIKADKETIEAKVGELAKLSQDLAALQALRDDLENDILAMTDVLKDKDVQLDETSGRLAEKDRLLDEQGKTLAEREKTLEERNRLLEEKIKLLAERNRELAERDRQLEEKDKAVAKERNLADSARAQIALANQQMAALREQLARISEALEVAEQKAKDQGVQISALGKRLNSALASKVQELSRYRSEFFGRLRSVLGNQPGIRVVGDRFVFQSEVLFASGSAELGEDGMGQLKQLAATLRGITGRIPKDIDWILRIDGHTDSIPISTWKFPSNWELSSARAISVVKFLIGEGIPAGRLAAAGFGEFRPIDTADDEVANRRNRRIEMKMTQR